VRAYYRDDAFLEKYIEVKVIELREQMQLKVDKYILNDVHKLARVVNFFNYQNEEVVEVVKLALTTILEKDQGIEDHLNREFATFMRTFALFWRNNKEAILMVESMINWNLRHDKEVLDMEYFSILNTVLNWFPEIENSELRKHVSDIVKWQPSSTIISKFQQDVLSTLRNQKMAHYDIDTQDYSNLIEKDLVIKMITIPSKDSETPSIEIPWYIIVEANGLWHYPRNSEEMLGKDKLKMIACNALYSHKINYAYLDIPYFDWTVIEEEKKPLVLNDLILNWIGLVLVSK
jgi:hypothetical protein